jgi:ATP-binding cassette subfamily A (ABC1) protein 3
VGYHLALVKASPQTDVKAITQLITSLVPAAVLKSHVSAEVSFTLPAESAARFPELFTALEEGRERLGIHSFGASITTLEEVFMKYGIA